jgi:ubiquinol-cytochrome c reductase cytochrome b subunit
MFSAILIILTIIFLDISKIRGLQFRPLSKIFYYIFGAIFLGLMILGAKHVESPFIEYGQIFTTAYFSFFLVIVPSLSYIENSAIKYSIYRLGSTTKK